MTLIGRIIKASIDLRGKIEIVPFSPFISQKRVLKKLIRKAQFTMFGEAYNFQGMLGNKNFVTKFRATVPVHDYNSIFSNWCCLIMPFVSLPYAPTSFLKQGVCVISFISAS